MIGSLDSRAVVAPAPIPPHEESPEATASVYMPPSEPRQTSVPVVVERDGFRSIQVNVDHRGRNILHDAANEPSIAIDPTDPRRIVIGWRQFDTVESSFREAGWAYSHDAGHSWVFRGVLNPGVFGSDPVLAADAEGRFYYHTIRCARNGCGDLYRSCDSGRSWHFLAETGAGDKPWMALDKTNGIGKGNIYINWTHNYFVRSTDGGHSFETGSLPSSASWGTIAVAANGTVYVSADKGHVDKSTNANDADAPFSFEPLTQAQLGFILYDDSPPNPSGLSGQVWIAVAPDTQEPLLGMIMCGSVGGIMNGDLLNVLIVRSDDGGSTWDESIRINDDALHANSWQWFATMSVAPSGRIDIVWNDTRNYLDAPSANLSELYYSYSVDRGTTWSKNIPLSPVFDSYVGWPGLNFKLGDYYHMLSDNLGVNVAWAATFNGEQDIYFLRIGPWDCNGNEIPDDCDIDCNAPGCSVPVCDAEKPPEREADGSGIGSSATHFPGCIGNAEYTGIKGYLSNVEQVCGRSLDCNANGVPDECEFRGDFDGDGLTTLSDLASMQRCYSGRQQGNEATRQPEMGCCGLFDLEPDGDVDLEDFTAIQRVHFGP